MLPLSLFSKYSLFVHFESSILFHGRQTTVRRCVILIVAVFLACLPVLKRTLDKS